MANQITPQQAAAASAAYFNRPSVTAAADAKSPVPLNKSGELVSTLTSPSSKTVYWILGVGVAAIFLLAILKQKKKD